MNTEFILASASPQRKMLLEGLGLSFEVVTSSVDEEACKEKNPAKRAQVLASLKARDVHTHRPGIWIIGCDTLVVAENGALLEKPKNAEEAEEMLRLHSDTVSIVHSALSLIAPDGAEIIGLSTSKVFFKKLTEEDIRWWVDGGFWKERSGGFQIDGLGQLLIKNIEGDWTSIVGFPVFLFGELCKQAGAPFLVRRNS